ncbi:hypothetical protein [Micromonospora sp. NPDC048830]
MGAALDAFPPVAAVVAAGRQRVTSRALATALLSIAIIAALAVGTLLDG